MKLIDIILESEAAEEAKRLGLVKKPGFGLYGPTDGPATHRSRGGKLVPTQAAGQGGAPQSTVYPSTQQTAPTNTPEPTGAIASLPKEPPSPEEVAKVEERMARRKTAPPTTRVGPLVARMLQALPDGKIKDPEIPVAVISQYYGRTDIPQIYMGDDLAKKVKPEHAIVSETLRDYQWVGVYIFDIDAIGVKRTIDRDTPMSEWEPEPAEIGDTPKNRESYKALHTLVHEAIHGVNRNIFNQETSKFKRDSRGIAIDEGLTEVMAQSIMSGLVENDDHYEKMSFGDPETRSYSEFTRPIRLMEEFGGLDVDFLIRNHNKVNEQGQSVVLTAIGKAQTQTIQTIITDAGLEASQIDEILELTQQGWDKGHYLLSNSEVSKTLREFVTDTSEIDDEARKNLYEKLLYHTRKDYFRPAY